MRYQLTGPEPLKRPLACRHPSCPVQTKLATKPDVLFCRWMVDTHEFFSTETIKDRKPAEEMVNLIDENDPQKFERVTKVEYSDAVRQRTIKRVHNVLCYLRGATPRSPQITLFQSVPDADHKLSSDAEVACQSEARSSLRKSSIKPQTPNPRRGERRHQARPDSL